MSKGAFALWVLAAAVAAAVVLILRGQPGPALDAKPVPDVVRFGRSLELCTQEANAAMKELSMPSGGQARTTDGPSSTP